MTEPEDIRWQQRFENFEKAYLLLQEGALIQSPSDIDMAVKGEAVSHHVISSLTNMLQEELPIPFFFDIIHYETITSNNLLEHINRAGISIYPIHE